MKKNIYELDNIDCIACATKIEKSINKLEGVFSCKLNYILLKLIVIFDENIVSDEEIEKCIHKALKDVKIIQKNNKEFIDTYEEPKKFKKMIFKPRR